MIKLFNPFVNNDKFEVTIASLKYNVVKDTKTDVDSDNLVIKINTMMSPQRQLLELIDIFYKECIKEYRFDTNVVNSTRELAINTMFLFDETLVDWIDNSVFPYGFHIGSQKYTCSDMPEVDQYFTSFQYGITDHAKAEMAIAKVTSSTLVDSTVREVTFWHEYMHCLFDSTWNTKANASEFIVDNLGRALWMFLKPFKIKYEQK